VRREIMVTKESETFALPLPGEPVTFRFDEGGWLLGTVKTDQTPAELAELARHDLEWAARNWALRELAGSADSAAVAARRFVLLNERSAPLRAVAVAQMASDKSPAGMEAVRSALRDPDSEVRSAALMALFRLDSAAAGSVAQALMQNDPNDAVRATALVAYARSAGAAAVPALIAATAVGLPTGNRATAAAALGRLKDRRAADALERLTAASEPRNLRTGALDALVQLGDSTHAAAVATKGLTDYDPLYAVQAVRVLGRVGGAAGRAALVRAQATEPRVTVKAAMAQALKAR
jgi:HEAT repeat protein